MRSPQSNSRSVIHTQTHAHVYELIKQKFFIQRNVPRNDSRTSSIVRHHELSILKFMFNFPTQKFLAFSITGLPFWSNQTANCEIQRSHDACYHWCHLHKFYHSKWILSSICGIYGIKLVDSFTVYKTFDRNVILSIISLWASLILCYAAPCVFF